MPRKKTKKKMGILQDKTRRNATLLLVSVIVLLGAGSSLFAAFGPESGWEADVALSGVGFDSTMYTMDSPDIDDLASLLTARIVKVDFDGSAVDQHSTSSVETYTYFGGSRDYDVFDYNAAGMEPKVDFSVGQFFAVDSEGNPILDYGGEWENVTTTEGKLKFYFGFSVAFTTRAEIQTYAPADHAIMYAPYAHDYYWHNYEKEFGDIDTIAARAIIDLNVKSLTNFTYEGTVDSVTVLGTPTARYTIDAADAELIDTSIDSFNSVYDWKAEYTPGHAAPYNPTNPVVVTYNVINTTTDNVAQIQVGAVLRPGADCNTYTVGLAMTTGLGGGPENVYTQDLFIYNVELIYNFVVETSLNGIPITAMGDWLSGRIDNGIIPPPPEPTFWEQYWWLIVAIAVVCVLGGGSRR